MTRTCRHCQQPYSGRAGRGLCRECWDDADVRADYDLVAPFGGKGASMLAPRKLPVYTYRLERKGGVWVVVRTTNGTIHRTASEHGTEQEAERALRGKLAEEGVTPG